MLATILKSEQAVGTTIALIDTSVQVRQMARTMEQLQNVADGGIQQQNLPQKQVRFLPMLLVETYLLNPLKRRLSLTLLLSKGGYDQLRDQLSKWEEELKS